MKTASPHKKSGARLWALAFGLFTTLAVLPLRSFGNESDLRLALVPGMGTQNAPAHNGSFTPSYNPATQPNLVLPSNGNWNPPVNNTPRFEELFQNTPSVPTETVPSLRQPTIDEELAQRYTDPRMLRFLSSTSMSQLTSLYTEMSRLIDQRHVSPLSYEQRTQRALSNLSRAIENPTFLQAVRANGNSANVRQAQAELTSLASRQPARSAQEAVSVMQYAASLLNRSLGIPMEATALEFINGTIDSLDQYSAFVPAETAQRPSASLEERIVGIGVELKSHSDGLQIVGVVDGGPAQAAKLQRGDIIVAINNQSIRGMSLNQAADLITGPAGSSVHLNVVRDGRNGTVTLQRRSVYVGSVTGVQIIDPQQKIGYIRLKQFSESSAADLEKALWKLYQEGMQTLVFDLRGNPGGLLTAAIEISNKFIAQGSIVSTKGRTAEDNTNERATFDRTWKVPLVVLIDENSASASEIFAAAIQDNQRGVIVGRRSYGKGTVQTHFPLRSATGELKLTTAKFYAPSGREMAGAGVIPDVSVPAASAGLEFAPERDGDIQMAIRLAAAGQPADLASRAGNNQARPQGVSQYPL
ncbi:MAG: S41 family peptidase [Planctomycetaceae bacterium]|nr:S41 family peptidase [Planctomycetaceae bacterium]